MEGAESVSEIGAGRTVQDLQLTSWYSAREERWCMDNNGSSSNGSIQSTSVTRPDVNSMNSTATKANNSNSIANDGSEMHGRDSFTRAVYIAKLKRGVNRENLSLYHEQIMNSLKSFNEAKVTGILLVYNDVVLHLLEAPADILSSFFTYLNDKGKGTSEENKYKNTEQMYEEVKILISSEDCP